MDLVFKRQQIPLLAQTMFAWFLNAEMLGVQDSNTESGKVVSFWVLSKNPFPTAVRKLR